METEIKFGPGSSAVRVMLKPGESVLAESGAMISMSGDMQAKTTTRTKGSGGIFKGVKRIIGGESFFINHFTAGSAGGEIWFSHELPGDMIQHDLNGDAIVAQGGSFVACSQDVDMDVNWQGFKNLFTGEGLFWVKMKGTGKAILASFGSVYEVPVNGSYIVDTGHIVAFDETLNFGVTKAGKSWINSFLGGEGLVCRFEGTGRVWVQSHNPPKFGHLLTPYLKPRR